MGDINAWVCICERVNGIGNKCGSCREAILHNLSDHQCENRFEYGGECQKKFGW